MRTIHIAEPDSLFSKEWFKYQLRTLNVSNLLFLVVMIYVTTTVRGTLDKLETQNDTTRLSLKEAQEAIAFLQQLNEQMNANLASQEDNFSALYNEYRLLLSLQTNQSIAQMNAILTTSVEAYSSYENSFRNADEVLSNATNFIIESDLTPAVDFMTEQLAAIESLKEAQNNTRHLLSIPPKLTVLTSALVNEVFNLSVSPSPLYIRVRMVGGGGGGGGAGSGATSGIIGESTMFGDSIAEGGQLGACCGGSGHPGEGGFALLGSDAVGVAQSGGQGVTGAQNYNSGYFAVGGKGGDSPFGSGGSGGLGNYGGRYGTPNSGGGGGGGGQPAISNTYSGHGGGAGGFADFYIYSPRPQYTWYVGQGGSGGAGQCAGGRGGDGRIEVTEYFQG